MGTLRELTAQPVTKARYAQARESFYTYLREHHIILPTQAAALDSVVGDYLEHLWASGAGRTEGSNILAALQDVQPRLKGKLVESWRLLKTWTTHEVPNRAPPLPLEVVHAMVGYAMFKQKPQLALSFLLAFHGLLRTGELLNVRGRHVAIRSPRGPAVISLGLTKSGKRQGAAESVTVHGEDVCRRLFQWVQRSPPNVSLTGPAHVWRKEFSSVLSNLGFSRWDFRPYSLRRGGATYLFSSQTGFDQLLVAGRWQSAKTARVYLNEGLSVLAEMTLPWSSFSKNFRQQYSRSLTLPLPPLEPVPKQAQSRGTWKKCSRTKNAGVACNGFGLSCLGFGRTRKNPSLFIPWLESPWVWLGVSRGIRALAFEWWFDCGFCAPGKGKAFRNFSIL